VARAWARGASAEMHSGFRSLRDEFGMNVRLRLKRHPSPQTASEIARIASLWREGRERFGSGGGFLCGAFGIVDAFWCPVAFRFQTYGVSLERTADAYQHALLDLPAMREWATDSATERERIASVDPPEAQAQQQ
jgi:glutathione S-transferase